VRDGIAQSVWRRTKGWKSGVRSPAGVRVFFSAASRSALGRIQPPIQWAPGALSTGVKRQRLKINSPLPSSTEVKNGEAIARFHAVVRKYE
jgi:hypothetical protein